MFWSNRRMSASFVAVNAVIGLALLSPVAAQDDDASTVVDTIVVTASRIETSIDRTPESVSLLDQETLEHAPALVLDDTLRRVPGFSLFRRSSSVVAQPTTQGVSLRGIGPSGVSRTLILLDGVPMNDPFGGWVYWSRIASDRVERVEVVRGGSSSVWGSSALGGVIQLFTRKPEGSSLLLSASAGERSTLKADVGWGQDLGPVGIALDADVFDTDGYHTLRQDQRGPVDVPASSEHVGFAGRLDGSRDGPTDFFVRIESFDEDRSNGTPLTNNDTEIAALSAGFDYSSGQSAWSFRAYAQDQEFASTFSSQAADRSTESPALDQFLVDTEAWGASAQWTRALSGDDAGTLSAGLDLSAGDGATNEDFFFSNGAFVNRRRAGGEQLSQGAYFQGNLRPRDRWQLNLGVRANRWESSDGQRLEFNIASGQIRRDDRFEDRDETELSPKVAVLYEASRRWRVRGSAYQAFRFPTINELYRPFRVGNDITAANAALEPEKLRGVELGASFRGDFELDLNVFHNEMEDPVANVTLALGPGVIAPCGFTPSGGSCRQRRNLGETEIQGLEAEVRKRVGSRWLLSGSYLYTEPEVKEATGFPDLVGKRVAQVPEHQLSAVADFRSSRTVDATLQVRWVDEQFEDDLNARTLDDFVVADLWVGRPLGGATVFAAVENIFDEEIEVGRSGNGQVRIGAPRVARLGVRWRWGGQ